MSKYDYGKGKYIVNIVNTSNSDNTNTSDDTRDFYYQSDVTSENESDMHIHNKQTDKTFTGYPVKRGRGRPRSTKPKSPKFKKPANGSKQDNFTKDDILNRIQGLTPFTTLEEKKILYKLQRFAHIKYFDKRVNKFRTGGFLVKNNYPTNIILTSPKLNLTWSVSLSDDIILMINMTHCNQQKLPKHKSAPKQKTSNTVVSAINTRKSAPKSIISNVTKSQSSKITLQENSSSDFSQENKIKNKLYELYKEKRLKICK